MIDDDWAGMSCFVCGGEGFVRPYTNPFSVENVQAFADFLHDSGGFEIW